MEFDLEDMLAGTFGRIILTFLFVVSATWSGSVVGELAWMISYGLHTSGMLVGDLLELWTSPIALVNVWIVPNVAFLAAAVAYLMVSENTGYAWWGIVMGMESLFVMLGETTGVWGSRENLWAWPVWLVILALVEGGVWYLRALRMNRWARQVEEFRIESAMERAERDALRDEAGAVDDDEDS